MLDNTVAVAKVLKTSLAVRQLCQEGSHHALRVVEDFLHDFRKSLAAVFIGQVGQSLARPSVGSNLCTEVAPTLVGCADIRPYNRLDVPVEFAFVVYAHWRKSKTFAIDFRHRAVAARSGAADIRPMSTHAAKPEQLAFIEGGTDDIDVRQMRAAEIGVIVNEHIAIMDIVAKGLDHRAHCVRHRAEMDWQIRALRHHVAFRVEDAAGIVARDFQDWRIGGFGEDDLHLLGRLEQAVLDHFKRCGIGLAFVWRCVRHCRYLQ